LNSMGPHVENTMIVQLGLILDVPISSRTYLIPWGLTIMRVRWYCAKKGVIDEVKHTTGQIRVL